MSELFKHTAVKAYIQHGFSPVGENETQIFGACPFCGMKEHKKDYTFYVNKKTKAWDCKACTREGGFKTFLSQISRFTNDYFKGSKAIELAKNRGLKLKTLKYFDIGFNLSTGKYAIPVKDSAGIIRDIQIYIYGNPVISTFTCKSQLFGIENLVNDPKIIFLMEGIWDNFAMYEIMQKVVLDESFIILSVPGAKTFKNEWASFFSGKRVYVLYDNDNSGQTGAVKVFNMLHDITEKLFFIRWKTEHPEKFDIRDLYIKNKCDGKKTYAMIQDMLHNYPKDIDEEEQKTKKKKSTINYNGDGVSAKEVRNVYGKWLHLPNGELDAIDYMFGTIIGNRLQDVPAWGIIEAASGFIKSTLIGSISEAKGVHAEDNMSSAGLSSGYTNNNKKGDASPDISLMAIIDGKTLAIKDITAILSSRPEERDAVFGKLRPMFDGDYKHRYGNISRSYKAKFGFICGATEVIKKFLAEQGHLGERFYVLTLNLPEDKEVERGYVKRAITNSDEAEQMDKELKDIANKCLNYDFVNKMKPIILPEKLIEKLSYLAMYVSMLRGKVEIDKYTKEIRYKAVRELGTRIAKQYVKLLKGICYFRGVEIATESEYRIIKRSARSTAQNNFENIVYACYRNSVSGIYTPESFSKLKDIKFSPSVCKMMADSLFMLEVFNRESKGYSNFEYTFREDFLNIIEKSEIYKNKTKIRKKKRKVKNDYNNN